MTFFFRKIFLILLLSIFCYFFAACDGNKTEIVQQKVAELVDKARQKKESENRAILLREAEKIVDSLLLSEAKMSFLDSLAIGKPQKPAKPKPIPPIDSLEVKPLFEQ